MTGVLFSKLFNDELHPLGAKRQQKKTKKKHKENKKKKTKKKKKTIKRFCLVDSECGRSCIISSTCYDTRSTRGGDGCSCNVPIRRAHHRNSIRRSIQPATIHRFRDGEPRAGLAAQSFIV